MKPTSNITLRLSEIENLGINSETNRLTYIWGTSQYSVHKAYNALIGHMPTHPMFTHLWSSKCQSKHKVFFWLLLHDKHNARDRLRRMHMALESYICENCILHKVESVYHIFLICNFVVRCWESIGIVTPRILCPQRAVNHLTRQLRHNCSLEIIVLMA
jgi:hypothetical protein